MRVADRMTSLLPGIKDALVGAILVALAALAVPAQASDFAIRRGLNLDIWTTWPPEAQWGDPDVLLPYPEWRRTLDASKLEALKASGFDFLRIPVDPAPFLSPASGHLRDRLLASVAEAVAAVNAAGLRAVVDLHSIPRGEAATGTAGILADEAGFTPFLELVRDVARILSADPEMVALELMNEPVIDCGDGEARWPGMLRRLHAAARASAPRTTLILPGACWSSAEGLARLAPETFPGDDVMWTFHSYQPFLLTHQGAEWAGDFIRYVTGLAYPLNEMPRADLEAALAAIRARISADAPWHRRAGMLAYLDEQVAGLDTAEEVHATMAEPFEKVRSWAERHGVQPDDILLGEFGMIRQEYGNASVVPAASRAAYLRDMIALAEKHGFAWSIWGYGGAFGVIEQFEGRPAEPDVLDAVRTLR